MRLLNAKSYLFEDSYNHSEPTKYAILSHTWSNKELTFKDLAARDSRAKLKADPKISGCCEKALSHGLTYVWIDTICIDKSSSAELSEAINSMYDWYSNATVCYAYLSDVHSTDKISRGTEFRQSRWFTRAWTLQELLAPRDVYFYDSTWLGIGRKLKYHVVNGRWQQTHFDELLSAVTQIATGYLAGPYSVRDASVSEKMRWAAHRQATRKEDIAYSLMGLFGVNMAMLYGEGDKAFIRLQEQILADSDDETIFEWSHLPTGSTRCREHCLLAHSPADFEQSTHVYRDSRNQYHLGHSTHYYMTNKGLHMERQVLVLPEPFNDVLMIMGCTYNPLGSVVIPDMPVAVLPLTSSTSYAATHSQLQRSNATSVVGIRPKHLVGGNMRQFYIAKSVRDGNGSSGLSFSTKRYSKTAQLNILESYPTSWTITLEGNLSVYLPYYRDRDISPFGQQKILLHLKGSNNMEYLVSIDYCFTKDPIGGEQPVSLHFDIAAMPRNPSLADLILENQGDVLPSTKDSSAFSEDRFIRLVLDRSNSQRWILMFHIGEEGLNPD